MRTNSRKQIEKKYRQSALGKRTIREWKAANRNRIVESAKGYYQTNKAELCAKNRNYSQTITAKYGMAKRSAKERRYDFYLTKEDYASIIADNSCHYCGLNLPQCGTSIDRKGNEPWYKMENTVACCTRCNSAFNRYFCYEEKLIIASAIKKIDELRDLHNFF